MAIIGVVLATSACGGGDNENSAPPQKKTTVSPSPTVAPPSPSPGVTVATKDQLSAALLEPAQVGTGFRVGKTDSGTGDKPDHTTNQRCTDLFHTELDSSFVPVSEVDRLFETTETGPRVIQNVAAFAAVDHAVTAIHQFDPLITECTDWTETYSYGAVSYSVTVPQAPAVGEEARSVAMTMIGNGFAYQTRFVLLRIANNAAMLVITTEGEVDDTQINGVAQQAAEKLAAVPHA